MLLVGGFNPSEKYEFVSWDDEIPNLWKIIQMFQISNQVSLPYRVFNPTYHPGLSENVGLIFPMK